ncbi:hypothetical protein NE237_018494 [Protea cynaroides]|uniref:Cytochrome b-c1 complex subunit 8 n=1 Tax=Protea cynaroides TaxID=273540 RepID=A0A9Q0QP24_9MAGN|nr:hypothetical protein NE237_018494 [Protea cynaroides]
MRGQAALHWRLARAYVLQLILAVALLRDSRRDIEYRMAKARMKVVIYSLSPFQQKVMPGLWKDFTGKIHQKVTENWLGVVLLVTPVVGTYTYAMNYKEQEKLAHRY